MCPNLNRARTPHIQSPECMLLHRKIYITTKLYMRGEEQQRDSPTPRRVGRQLYNVYLLNYILTHTQMCRTGKYIYNN